VSTRLCASFFAVVLIASIAGCSISEKEEIEIGRKTHAQFEQQSGGMYPDPQVQAYVSSVGMSLAQYAGRPTLDWQFAVVNSSQVNAFAVPGGYIYITQGLLFRLSNEAQLAGVLAHEATHISHRHSVKQMESAKAMQGVSFAAGVVGGLFGVGGVGSATSLVASLSLMKYGRDQEKDADLTGLLFMTQAGYNPQGMVQMMQTLQASSGGKGPPQFLSSHPDPGNRVEYLKKTIEQNHADAAARGEFGEERFRQNVLSTRPVAIRLIDLRQPEIWCAVCAQRAPARYALARTARK
jgi:predicted Zn-dependent protease